jgi:hypothetical protein
LLTLNFTIAIAMPHLISDDQIERLSSLGGVSFDEFKHQLEKVNPKINNRLHDLVEVSWQNCFPVWLEFGRVRDLSHGYRVPYYFPAYAKYLGDQFVEIHYEDYAYLINLLKAMPINSYEYLCAYDLLEMIADKFYEIGESVPEEIYAIDLPIPPVVCCEKGWDNRFCGLESIGRFIYQSCLISYGEEP